MKVSDERPCVSTVVNSLLLSLLLILKLICWFGVGDNFPSLNNYSHMLFMLTQMQTIVDQFRSVAFLS